MAEHPKGAGQVYLSLSAIAVRTQIDLLILDSPPQPLAEDVVVAALSSRTADLDLLSLQSGHKVVRAELIALVGMEDLRPAAAAEGYLQGLHTEHCFKVVGELPSEHMSGVEIHVRYQVEEPFCSWIQGM